jgi:uncharacterized repeat protein (TIGR01451 family)
VVNAAVANGVNPGGKPLDPAPSSVTTPTAGVAALVLAKKADASAVHSPAKVGELITFAFTITNTGSRAASDVVLTDALPGLSAVSMTWPGEPGTLRPGEVAMGTASYPLTAADLAAGMVVNTATVSGKDPDGSPVSEGSLTATTQTPVVAPVPAPSPSTTPTPPPKSTPTPASPGKLPFTGAANVVALMGGSLGLVVFGALVLVASRRRRRAEPASGSEE